MNEWDQARDTPVSRTCCATCFESIHLVASIPSAWFVPGSIEEYSDLDIDETPGLCMGVGGLDMLSDRNGCCSASAAATRAETKAADRNGEGCNGRSDIFWKIIKPLTPSVTTLSTSAYQANISNKIWLIYRGCWYYYVLSRFGHWFCYEFYYMQSRREDKKENQDARKRNLGQSKSRVDVNITWSSKLVQAGICYFYKKMALSQINCITVEECNKWQEVQNSWRIPNNLQTRPPTANRPIGHIRFLHK